MFMKRRQFVRYMAMFFLTLTSFGFSEDAAAASEGIEVLATTFPIHQITQNVIQGRDNVNLELMLPAQLGCPHDYALTPQDMQRLSKADILVINGLGMEEFLDDVKMTNPGLKIIDSSAGIRDILQYADVEGQGNGRNEGDHGRGHHEGHDHEGEHAHGHGHGHVHSGANPHLFASPRMAAILAVNIAKGLAEADPAGAETYHRNARAYALKMNSLADDFSALGKRLKNNRIVTQHGVFDYLARDMGLKVVAVIQAHAGQDPSAARMLEIIATAKREKAGAVFTEPQYPEKTGRAIASEAGIPTATLDPVATGPDNAPADYYETVMRKNLKIIEQTLGVK
ncbi:MAG: zinc ABC transporter substrate-binding protein [Deltaproteobacteria bacterium]